MDEDQYDELDGEEEQETQKPKKLHILRSTLAMLTTIALVAAGLLAPSRPTTSSPSAKGSGNRIRAADSKSPGLSTGAYSLQKKL